MRLTHPEARRGDLLGRRIGAEAKPNVATKQALAFHPFGQQGRSPERLAAFSDDALALRFAELHANDLRYVAEWSKWLRCDGMRWQVDNTLAVFDSVRVICRAAAAECDKARLGKGAGEREDRGRS